MQVLVVVVLTVLIPVTLKPPIQRLLIAAAEADTKKYVQHRPSN
jgi:hypothetical protein